jgi:hypothetical protein
VERDEERHLSTVMDHVMYIDYRLFDFEQIHSISLCETPQNITELLKTLSTLPDPNMNSVSSLCSMKLISAVMTLL